MLHVYSCCARTRTVSLYVSLPPIPSLSLAVHNERLMLCDALERLTSAALCVGVCAVDNNLRYDSLCVLVCICVGVYITYTCALYVCTYAQLIPTACCILICLFIKLHTKL